MPLAARVVEVIADLEGSYRYGSGFIVQAGTMLTAAHVVAGAVSVSVRDPDKRMFPASADPRFTGDPAGPGPDLALLEIDHPELDLPPVGLARVDRDSPTGKPVDDCQVIGYPAFMEQDTPDGGQVRETADASGRVPVLGRLAGGLLSVQVTQTPRSLPPGEIALGDSEWSGMSGAPLLAGGLLLGVVSEHAPREGSSAITAIPLTALEADPAHPGWGPGVPEPDTWWDRLGVSGIGALRRLPPRPDQAGIPLLRAGWPLDEVRDPFALEVHRPVQSEDPQPSLPVLPAYMSRDHDAKLGQVVRAAADGRSGIAVLVGGSSTGKTRACWEALGLLRDGSVPWRLWHPIDPSHAEAALRELAAVGPRTVVWLNEAQLYLDPADGERVAAGLRELLRDPARRPVLVLATLWPRFWDDLTADPADGADPHAQARQLLDGHDITVPGAFTAVQLQRLSQLGDPRLAQAAGAPDGQVIQFLAGAPELLARYRNAPPAAAALIHAAMDARRLGMGIALPRAFLEAAAPGYLTDAEWDALAEDWKDRLEQALDYAAKGAKGVRGPLTRIRPRPSRSGAIRSGSRDSDEQLTGGPAGTPGGPLYRLADYLDQHGQTHRKDQIPPADFWAATADHAFPADQSALGDAAHDRGLYQAAARLHKNAAAHGNPRTAFYLANTLPHLLADVRPLYWAAAHISFENPRGVFFLLRGLRAAGADEQVAALLHRDPAAHVALEDPQGVSFLLGALRAAGADEQVAALLHRDPAAHVALDNPQGVSALLGELREAGADEQAVALADRAAADCPLDDTVGVAGLLGGMRAAGADEQAVALADRAAADCPLDRLGGVAFLLGELRKAGAHDQAAALASRAAAHVPLGATAGVVALLGELREAGAGEQAAVLAGRAAAHAALDNPDGVAWLLRELREAGAHEQAAALAGRAAAHAALDDTAGVAALLGGCGRRARTSRSPRCCTVILPLTSPSTTRPAWPPCWTACGGRARTSRPPPCCTVIPPPTPPSRTRRACPSCWARCGRRARTSRSPRCCTVIPPPTSPSTTRPACSSCCARCGRRARTSRPPRCCTVIPPPTPPSTTRSAWSPC